MEAFDKRLSARARETSRLDASVELGHLPPFRLGGLLVEPMLKRLSTDDGREEFVEPKVMKVLIALARADGSVLTRGELMESCWPGVVVGDDALSRVLSRLRRIGEGIGDGRLVIETHARVGCRLVVKDPAEAAPAAARSIAPDDRASALPIPDAPPRRSPRARRLALIAAAAAALLVAFAVVAFFALRPSAPPAYTLRIAPFRLLDGSAPAYLPDMIRQQIEAAFDTDSAIATVAGEADFALGGTIAREGGQLHYSLDLTDREGRNVSSWTQTTSIVAIRSAAQVSMKAAGLLRCGLVPLRQHSGELPRRLRNLFVRLCTGGIAGRRLDIARSLTREAPDFAGGWSQLGYAYGSAAFAGAAPEAAGFRAQARAAAAQAIALNPQSSSGYRVLAWTQSPGTDYAKIETLLRKAISTDTAGCSCEHRDYGDFLLDVGRVNAALGEYQRAVDVEAGGSERLSVAHAWYFAGRPERAQEELDAIEAMWGDARWIGFARLDRALALGDWRAAARLIARAADSDDERAIAAAFVAVADGDRGRMDALLPTIVRIARVPALDRWKIRPPMLDERPALLLALMGRDQAALDAIAALLARYGADGGQLLFNPLTERLRRAPGYRPLLERSGIMRYWRTSGSAPDFCATASAPAFCAELQGGSRVRP